MKKSNLIKLEQCVVIILLVIIAMLEVTLYFNSKTIKTQKETINQLNADVQEYQALNETLSKEKVAMNNTIFELSSQLEELGE